MLISMMKTQMIIRWSNHLIFAKSYSETFEGTYNCFMGFFRAKSPTAMRVLKKDEVLVNNRAKLTYFTT